MWDARVGHGTQSRTALSCMRGWLTDLNLDILKVILELRQLLVRHLRILRRSCHG